MTFSDLLALPSLPLFITTAFILAVTPGPAVMYIVATSIGQGRRAGIVSVSGVALAGLCHVLAAALGLSAILAASALAFDLVKYLGAAYLIFLGVRAILSARGVTAIGESQPRNFAKIFRQGFIVNILNPKTALFFLALLPQFVNPQFGQVALQIAFLGIIFIGIAFCTDNFYAALSSRLSGLLGNNQNFVRGQRYFSGVVFIILGISAAFTGQKK
jgi:threonine/homoserine/homoserine lactone efflux protein